jgi:hypothetical protein
MHMSVGAFKSGSANKADVSPLKRLVQLIKLCRQWGASLPTQSHADTVQTKTDIKTGYATFDLACPEWVHLNP